MQPLIDGDVILYEAGFAAEAGWKGEDSPPFDYVAEVVDKRLVGICETVDATQPPIIFFTGKTNFRTQIAKRRKYKERASNKPFHYYNIKAYLRTKYECVQREGLEADDLMAIYQRDDTVICTRDKDLRQVPGWHYGWELANQPSFGPLLVDEFGKIELVRKKNSTKITGYGSLFFYAQCLVGDGVDTVPGLDGIGPVKAFNILEPTRTTAEAFKAVREAYRAVYGDDGDEELLEQGRLLWMVRGYDIVTLAPEMWEFPVE